MKFSFLLLSSLVIVLLALGCASSLRPRPVVPVLADEEVESTKAKAAVARIEDLIDDNARLLRIGYSLTVASAKQCGTLARLQSGLILSRSEFFEDSELRETVNREFEMGKDLSVEYVVEGSPFDRAGIQVGDKLLKLDGETLRDSYDFRAVLLKIVGRDTVDLELRRNGERFQQSVTLERGCPVVFKLASGYSLIASQKMQLLVVVPLGVVRQLDDDDTLAVVLAHELVHTCFDDKKLSWRRQEAEADRAGLFLAARAGYDVSGAVGYWETVAKEYPWLIREVGTSNGLVRDGHRGYVHHGIGNRLKAIRETVADIGDRRARIAEQNAKAVEAPTP